jgi:hypothetical protein
MRIAAINHDHNLGEIAFRPDAAPSDADYGLLYIASGDFGSVVSGQPEQLQRLDTPYGTLMRIDPLGGPFVRNGTTFDYGIPPDNPYVDDPDPDTLGEIYAHGLRNGHRISWDTGATGAMLHSDIGQGHIEEVNIAVPGANYGWPLREGTFAIDPEVDPEEVLPLPPNDPLLGFRYPVAQYDHDEGKAVAGGFVYRGTSLPGGLQGKFVFGDLVNGRLFYADAAALVAADDGSPATTAQVYELTLVYQGAETTLLDLVRDTLGLNVNRVDMRFGTDAEGEIYITTKQDGFVRRLVPVPPDCYDEGDNDGDGLVDFPEDPGCASIFSYKENPQCQDGLNNDPGQDSLIDFDGGLSALGYAATAPDPQCTLATKDRESQGGGGNRCGLAFEPVLLVPLLLWWRRRRRTRPA